jgi:hypothetical protein
MIWDRRWMRVRVDRLQFLASPENRVTRGAVVPVYGLA